MNVPSHKFVNGVCEVCKVSVGDDVTKPRPCAGGIPMTARPIGEFTRITEEPVPPDLAEKIGGKIAELQAAGLLKPVAYLGELVPTPEDVGTHRRDAARTIGRDILAALERNRGRFITVKEPDGPAVVKNLGAAVPLLDGRDGKQVGTFTPELAADGKPTGFGRIEAPAAVLSTIGPSAPPFVFGRFRCYDIGGPDAAIGTVTPPPVAGDVPPAAIPLGDGEVTAGGKKYPARNIRLRIDTDSPEVRHFRDTIRAAAASLADTAVRAFKRAIDDMRKNPPPVTFDVAGWHDRVEAAIADGESPPEARRDAAAAMAAEGVKSFTEHSPRAAKRLYGPYPVGRYQDGYDPVGRYQDGYDPDVKRWRVMVTNWQEGNPDPAGVTNFDADEPSVALYAAVAANPDAVICRAVGSARAKSARLVVSVAPPIPHGDHGLQQTRGRNCPPKPVSFAVKPDIAPNEIEHGGEGG